MSHVAMTPFMYVPMSGWFKSVKRLGPLRWVVLFFKTFGGLDAASSFPLIEVRVGTVKRDFLLPQEESLLPLDIFVCCPNPQRGRKLEILKTSAVSRQKHAIRANGASYKRSELSYDKQ